MIGKPAPPLAGVLGWKNAPVTLQQLRGKVVLLDYWGYWCGPCVQEMPHLIRAYEKYKDQGLAVVGVHVDLDSDSVDTAAKLDAKFVRIRRDLWHGKDLPFPTALVSGRPVEGNYNQAEVSYGVVAYPTEIVIGRDGRVIGHADRFGGVQTDHQDDAYIEQLLNAR